MSLSVKNEREESLARQLAKATGEGITEVIGNAVEEKLTKLSQNIHTKLLEEELLAMGRRNASRKLLEKRSADENLGYDKNGLPSGD